MTSLIALGDLSSAMETGFPCGRSNLVEEGLPHLRPFNLGLDGQLDFHQIYHVPEELAPKTKRRLSTGDILFNNTNSRELVGKVAYVSQGGAYGYSNHITRIQVDQTRCNPEYVAYHLKKLWKQGFFKSHCTQWVSQAAFGTKQLAEVRIPLPPKEKQWRIVHILNRAASIERLRDQASAKLRALVPALFIRMFGDPAENPMGWEVRSFGEVAEIQGGLQVTKKRAGLPIEKPYLRVANVLRDELILDEIKSIRLTESEFKRVCLQYGDLLIVEGHGNAGEVGRVAIWDGSIPDCVHQNHLIRARTDRAILLPEIAAAYLNSISGRQHLTRSGKTTSGLSTISTSNVKTCPLYVPPLELQKRYAEAVCSAKAMADTAHSATRSTLLLFNALMGRLLR